MRGPYDLMCPMREDYPFRLFLTGEQSVWTSNTFRTISKNSSTVMKILRWDGVE
jgi:hypothetical protein